MGAHGGELNFNRVCSAVRFHTAHQCTLVYLCTVTVARTRCPTAPLYSYVIVYMSNFMAE